MEIRNYTSGRMTDPATLKEYPGNPNRHPAAQIDALCEVIRENGWRQCVVVSKRSGYIVKGHGRRLAAEKLGVKVPVEYQDYPDEAAEARDLVADNRISELSMMDPVKVKELQRKFKSAAAGWGDVKTGGGLMSRQFGEMEERRPKEMKFPILILESQEEYEMFQAMKKRLGGSDAAVFGKILAAAFAGSGKEKGKVRKND